MKIPPPVFPVSSLGDFAYVAVAFQQEMGQPMGVIGTWILVCLAMATQHMADVETFGRGRRGLSLPFITVAPSGSGRTSTYSVITSPIDSFDETVYEQSSKDRGWGKTHPHTGNSLWQLLNPDASDIELILKREIPYFGIVDDMGNSFFSENDYLKTLRNYINHEHYRISFNVVPYSIGHLKTDVMYCMPPYNQFFKRNLLGDYEQSANVRYFISMWHERITSLLNTRPPTNEKFDAAKWSKNMKVLRVNDGGLYTLEAFATRAPHQSRANKEPNHDDYYFERMQDYLVRIAAILTIAHDKEATTINTNHLENAVEIINYYWDTYRMLANVMPVENV